MTVPLGKEAKLQLKARSVETTSTTRSVAITSRTPVQWRIRGKGQGPDGVPPHRGGTPAAQNVQVSVTLGSGGSAPAARYVASAAALSLSVPTHMP